MKPPRLRPGDTVGLVAPSSVVPTDALQAGVARIESLGYRVRYREDLLSDTGARRFAGSHERRAAEFREMLEDSQIRAIFCARGGYGCNYIVDFLDRRPLPLPKIVMGYSDITTLHTFFQRAGWVTFHGPMAGDFGRGFDDLGPALTSPDGWEVQDSGLETLREGNAEGQLLGGCLSLLVTTLGTRREVDWRGAIVMLEDLNEAPYRIDRMLFHLREAGKFQDVQGVVFGEMKDCGPSDLLRETIAAAFEGMNIPLAIGLHTGHTLGRNICIPLGVRARLDGDRLTFLEGAVSE